jgi:hypothetical protein
MLCNAIAVFVADLVLAFFAVAHAVVAAHVVCGRFLCFNCCCNCSCYCLWLVLLGTIDVIPAVLAMVFYYYALPISW